MKIYRVLLLIALVIVAVSASTTQNLGKQLKVENQVEHASKMSSEQQEAADTHQNAEFIDKIIDTVTGGGDDPQKEGGNPVAGIVGGALTAATSLLSF